MERVLRPERFDTDINDVNASKRWSHWLKTFDNFLSTISSHKPDELAVLTNFLSPEVYEYISDCATYALARSKLNSLYIKPKNEVYSRYLLANLRQQGGETIDQYVQKLHEMSKDCNFTSVTSEEYRDNAIRDAFISGIQSNMIRQRLLENHVLDLATAVSQARSLEMAEKQANVYRDYLPGPTSAATSTTPEQPIQRPPQSDNYHASAATSTNCYFCGKQRHPRSSHLWTAHSMFGGTVRVHPHLAA